MDDEVLRRAVETHQSDWKTIQTNYFPGITKDTLRKRAKKIGLTWTKGKVVWTKEELELLRVEIAKGTTIADIHAQHFSHRSLSAVQKQVYNHDFVIDFDNYVCQNDA